jgi:hypothetical protein
VKYLHSTWCFTHQNLAEWFDKLFHYFRYYHHDLAGKFCRCIFRQAVLPPLILIRGNLHISQKLILSSSDTMCASRILVVIPLYGIIFLLLTYFWHL